ncbi:DUF1648 domain-containing protein [Halorubrum salinarum]|uniref:DUF1648 domain-containing protein n=1 Tax=Halorubrum salinarum TaxID=2739057 RepID=A0A7D3XVD0_9EURY|nr:DUF1648 domain-containing protein [Halorubrum salinarum]QKG93569.1 DUF1648 domain-containing protein [Halorubrum salinarum]
MNPPARLLARQRAVAGLVTAALLALGVVLYGALPDQMAIHWNAAGEADNVVGKPVAVLMMPAIVVFVSVLFEVTGADVGERIVGSLAMLLLFVVQLLVFGVNLGYDVPIVPIALALAGGLVAVAVWFEMR